MSFAKYSAFAALTRRDISKSRIFGGKRVGTLAGTIAHEILLKAQQDFNVQPVAYEDDVHPFQDLVLGRLDGVLLDNVLAERRQHTIEGFTIQPQSVATSHYVGIVSPKQAAMRDQIDEMLRAAMRDGTLERIFRKWNVWNDDQPRLFAKVLAARSDSSSRRLRYQ